MSWQVRPVLDGLERMALAATTQHLVFWRPLQAMQRESIKIVRTTRYCLLCCHYFTLETHASNIHLHLYCVWFLFAAQHLGQAKPYAPGSPSLQPRIMSSPKARALLRERGRRLSSRVRAGGAQVARVSGGYAELEPCHSSTSARALGVDVAPTGLPPP